MYNIGQTGSHPMQNDPKTTPEKAKLTRKEYEEKLRKLLEKGPGPPYVSVQCVAIGFGLQNVIKACWCLRKRCEFKWSSSRAFASERDDKEWDKKATSCGAEELR
jgi:hypothetical protein